MRVTLLVLVAAAAVGCAGPPWDSNPDRSNARRGYAVKPVAEKDPPATLIARDRSICLVRPSRFHEIHVGDHVGCFWDGGEPLPQSEQRHGS
jgi:hypothetical protein